MRSERFNQLKIKLIGFSLFIFFLLIIFFLIRWQVIESEKYQVLASQRTQEIKIPSIRGGILMRDGSTLAYSEPRFDIYTYIPELEFAEEKEKQTKEEFIEKVALVLGDEEKVRDVLSSGPLWVKLADKVSFDIKDQLFPDDEDFIHGLYFELATERIYPEGNFLSHLLGFVGESFGSEELGRGGIEQYHDGILSAQEGFDFSERDSFGNVITISGSSPVEARRGSTLITTIDKAIQQEVERGLKAGVEQYNAKGATGIVMDPKTGEILALANYPSFDPNKFFEVEDQQLFRNGAIGTSYEIGSVMKVVTMSAGVDSGEIKPDTIVVDGHAGCEHLLEEKEVCTYDKKPQGALTALDALIKSDNIALFHTAEKIGQDTFYSYLKRFGVGAPTGIDISGESYSVLVDSKYWNRADLATYSYGHSYQVTPIQAIAAVGAVANSGQLMQPYVVSEIIDPSGEITKFPPVVVTNSITSESADIMMGMLNEVYKANIRELDYERAFKDYKLGMKSGTALIPCPLVPEEDCIGYSDQYNATYVGFDESDERSFVMIVKLEQPELVGTKYNLSYYNVRHVWFDIFAGIKDYMGVPKISN